MVHRRFPVEAVAAATLLVSLGLPACSRQDPPAGMSQTEGAADRSNRAGADGGGDGPTALSPADKARAAEASGSAAASTVTSSQTVGTSPMPTSAPVPSQGSTNAVEGTGQK
jgi:hypothetical protein